MEWLSWVGKGRSQGRSQSEPSVRHYGNRKRKRQDGSSTTQPHTHNSNPSQLPRDSAATEERKTKHRRIGEKEVAATPSFGSVKEVLSKSFHAVRGALNSSLSKLMADDDKVEGEEQEEVEGEGEEEGEIEGANEEHNHNNSTGDILLIDNDTSYNSMPPFFTSYTTPIPVKTPLALTPKSRESIAASSAAIWGFPPTPASPFGGREAPFVSPVDKGPRLIDQLQSEDEKQKYDKYLDSIVEDYNSTPRESYLTERQKSFRSSAATPRRNKLPVKDHDHELARELERKRAAEELERYKKDVARQQQRWPLPASFDSNKGSLGLRSLFKENSDASETIVIDDDEDEDYIEEEGEGEGEEKEEEEDKEIEKERRRLRAQRLYDQQQRRKSEERELNTSWSARAERVYNHRLSKSAKATQQQEESSIEGGIEVEPEIIDAEWGRKSRPWIRTPSPSKKKHSPKVIDISSSSDSDSDASYRTPRSSFSKSAQLDDISDDDEDEEDIEILNKKRIKEIRDLLADTKDKSQRFDDTASALNQELKQQSQRTLKRMSDKHDADQQKRLIAHREQEKRIRRQKKIFSKEEDARITDALKNVSRSETEKVLVSAFNLDIKRSDIVRLRNGQWLNDEIINFYIELLKERQAKYGTERGYPKCHFFNTHFYSMLLERGYARVRSWTRKVNLFEMDKIIIPIHLGNHWCMAIINLTAKRFEYYDSLGGSNETCFKALRAYIVEEAKDKQKRTLDVSKWTDFQPRDTPQQENGSDCGVFACKFAERAAVGAEKMSVFSQRDMPYYRRLFVLDILDKAASDT